MLEWVSPKMASDDWDIEPLDQWLEQMTGSSDLKVEPSITMTMPIPAHRSYCEYLWIAAIHNVEQIGPIFEDIQFRSCCVSSTQNGWRTSKIWTTSKLRSACALMVSAIRSLEYRRSARCAPPALTSSIYEDFLRFLLRAPIVVQEVAPVEETPLDGAVSYSNPKIFNSGCAGAARHPGGCSGAGNARGKSPESMPARNVPIEKDKNDPFANALQ